MHGKPLKDTAGVAAVLQLVATRAAAELEWERSEMLRMAHLHFVENLDRVNRAMRSGSDPDRMLGDVLDTVLAIFDCDRAWLIFPCDPEAEDVAVAGGAHPPRISRGLGARRGAACRRSDRRGFRRNALVRGTALLRSRAGNTRCRPSPASDSASSPSWAWRCAPSPGKAWAFGLHQCSHPRIWTAGEVRLFHEIGGRLTDGLNSLLMYRTAKERARIPDVGRRLPEVSSPTMIC